MKKKKEGKYTQEIKALVGELMDYSNTYALQQAGYTMRSIEKAVRDGAIIWTPSGKLCTKENYFQEADLSFDCSD